MTREEKILSKVNKAEPGVEIGGSDAPEAPSRAGYRFHIIDYLDSAALKKKYTGYGVNLDNVEEVNFVWNGELIQNLTEKKYYNCTIASPVIEHTRILIGFIKQSILIIVILYHIFYEDSCDAVCQELEAIQLYNPLCIFNICADTPGKNEMSGRLRTKFPGCFVIFTSNAGKDIGAKLAMLQLHIATKYKARLSIIPS